MKIALMGTRGIPACYSGYETFYENLAVRLAQRGHHVTVYNRRQYNNYPHKYYKGVRLIILPTIKTKHLDTLFHTFISIIHSAFQGYDIAYFSIVGNSPFTIFTRLLRVKTLLNVDGEDWKREKWSRLARIYLRFSEYIASIFPNLIVADSKVIQRRYWEQYRTRSIFIPYGANVLKNSDTRYLLKYSLEREKYILFVSRLVPENRAHLLIQAFDQVQTDFKLVIIGDAPYEETYKRRLRSLANNNVVFTGYLFGEGYQSLSSNCYLFVLPSAVNGTRPVLLDQMGFGNCVLVNNSPANLEVIGDAGLSFHTNDGPKDLFYKLDFLLKHPEIVHSYSKRAVERVAEHYSWERVTDQYERLFNALINQ